MEYDLMPLPEQMDEINSVEEMTDDQIEILRKQILVYTIISEQLIQLHNSLNSHNDLAGRRMGSHYNELVGTSHGDASMGRKRWHPNAQQLKILERLYDQDTTTPNKIKLQEIASGLSRLGMITTERNVHIWFQNRRGRSKQKEQAAAEKKSCGRTV